MKLLILGHARHGKDTVAELISDALGTSFISSSLFAAIKIRDKLEEGIGRSYDSILDMYEDRVNHRHMWKSLIEEYCSKDKGKLARELLNECDIYVGMRSMAEYVASSHMFDKVLWVDASTRHGIDTTMDIDFDSKEMLLLDNNGSLEDLEGIVIDLVERGVIC